MKKTLIATTFMFVIALPVFADDDVENGKKEFRKCAACHSVDEGVTKVGPSLFNVIGRNAGSLDYDYSPLLQSAQAAGLVWSQENIADYILNPTQYLSDFTGEAGNSKMPNMRVKSAANIVAYIRTLNRNE